MGKKEIKKFRVFRTQTKSIEATQDLLKIVERRRVFYFFRGKRHRMKLPHDLIFPSPTRKGSLDHAGSFTRHDHTETSTQERV